MLREQFMGLGFIIIIGVAYWWFGYYRKRDGNSSSGSVLDRFTHDLTQDARAGKIDAVIGRAEEIERVMHILSRRTKNNPLLLGEPGVGKTAVVEGIALKIARGDVPATVQGKRVLSLDLGALIGGTKYRGEFEERMKRLTNEIRDGARQIILFIDEVHMVEQAKGAEGAINVSDILKPALARGELQMIGATTWSEYAKYIKEDDALNRRLQPVVVGEPSVVESLQILEGIKALYEKHHQVRYSHDALQAAVRLAKKYIKDRFLPDKAIDLMDEAGAKVAIECHRHTHVAAGLLHAAAAHARQRHVALREERVLLEKEVRHLRVIEKRASEDQELADIRRRIEKLLERLREMEKTCSEKKDDPTPLVSVEDIREIVSDWIAQPARTIRL